jgi:DNA-directed RNA polymerase subunit RPC12/RpoP
MRRDRFFLDCPHCGEPLEVGARDLGRAVVCPECGGRILVDEEVGAEVEGAGAGCCGCGHGPPWLTRCRRCASHPATIVLFFFLLFGFPPALCLCGVLLGALRALVPH